jgi:ribosomal protein S5
VEDAKKNLVKNPLNGHQYHTNRKVNLVCLNPASHGTGVTGGAVRSVLDQ